MGMGGSGMEGGGGGMDGGKKGNGRGGNGAKYTMEEEKKRRMRELRTVPFFLGTRYLGMEQDQDQDLTKKLTGARVDPHQKSVLSLRCVVPLSVSAGNSICNLEPIVIDDLHAKIKEPGRYRY